MSKKQEQKTINKSKKKKIIISSLSAVLGVGAITAAIVIPLTLHHNDEPTENEYNVQLNFNKEHFASVPTVTKKKVGEDVVIEYTFIDSETVCVNDVNVTYNSCSFPLTSTDTSITIPYETLALYGNSTDISVNIETSRNYAINFDLGEGVAKAWLPQPSTLGQDVKCSYEALQDYDKQKICPTTSWITLNDSTERIYGIDAFDEITSTTFTIKQNVLKPDTRKIRVHLDCNDQLRWNNLSLTSEIGVYGAITSATYSPKESTIEMKYYCDSMYDLDLSSDGTYLEIDGQKFYYKDQRWSIDQENQKISFTMEAGSSQDTIITMHLDSKNSQIQILTQDSWMDDKTHFVAPYIEIVSAQIYKDISFKWLMANNYKLDTSDTSKTFCEIVLLVNGEEIRVQTSLMAEGNTLTIPWNEEWLTCKIVRIEAHAGSSIK